MSLSIEINNSLEYKGYKCIINSDAESESLYGYIEKISSVKTSFYAAVDDYLDMCKRCNREPDAGK